VPFTRSAQTEDEPPPTRGHPGLIRVTHDTWIEQSCCFEGILMHEVRANQAALVLRERRVSREGSFHLSRARLESLEQVAVTTEEVFEHISQLSGDRRGIQC